MKKIITILSATLIALLASAVVSNAQDARQRTAETVVQDVLAQMPAQNKQDFDVQFKDLATMAPKSVTILAGMLKPAEAATNALVEYALDGLVKYATAPENLSCRQAVKTGLSDAAQACQDKYNKQFLQTLLRLVNPAENQPAQQPAATEAELLSQYKSLIGSKNANDRCKAIWALADAQGASSANALLDALKDSDRSVRATALNAAESFANEDFCAKLSKKFKSLSDAAKADVVNWAGDNHIASMESLVLQSLGSKDAQLASIAVAAASKYATDEAADALIAKLGTGALCDKSLFEALSCINVPLSSKVNAAIKSSNGDRLCQLMKLASAKHMTETSPAIFSVLANKGGNEKQAALEALAGVVTIEDASFLATALNNASDDSIDLLKKAYLSAISTQTPDKQYELVKEVMSKASNPELFYTALAQSASDQAVNDLAQKAEAGSAEALKALCNIKNYKAYKPLMKAAANDESLVSNAVALVSKYENNIDTRCYRYTEALNLAKSSDMKAAVLNRLQDAPTMNAFLQAAKYLDDPELQIPAANAVKIIASKCVDDINYEDFVKVLNAAENVFANKDGADDVYAVSEIKKMIADAEPSPKTVLSPIEVTQQYEVLFDGGDLSKWEGNLRGYTPVNGAIYVAAQYGDDRNLYTKKEYKDFILRFEFCFTREGVNNGIGIRTPEGLDAAYFGMCEVQVLDHDAPIYADLRKYQVHGSVYGIVPAKRIVHKPLGEWSTEEIKVVGNHVTVTVNGEVIVDADVKEACQGHNIAPDGSDYNPYTVDHRNHPGLFNEKGHISFCGHGVGMKYRNVRILDLTAQQAAQTPAKAKKSKKK